MLDVCYCCYILSSTIFLSLILTSSGGFSLFLLLSSILPYFLKFLAEFNIYSLSLSSYFIFDIAILLLSLLWLAIASLALWLPLSSIGPFLPLKDGYLSGSFRPLLWNLEFLMSSLRSFRGFLLWSTVISCLKESKQRLL